MGNDYQDVLFLHGFECFHSTILFWCSSVRMFPRPAKAEYFPKLSIRLLCVGRTILKPTNKMIKRGGRIYITCCFLHCLEYYSYPLLMMVEIILNRSLAFMVFLEWAGMIMDCPVSKVCELPSIKISALPSMIWMNVSKGDIFSVRFSPESKETAVTFPVVFFMMVLLTTALGTYSMISTIMKTFDFSTSVFSIAAILWGKGLYGTSIFQRYPCLKMKDFCR